MTRIRPGVVAAAARARRTRPAPSACGPWTPGAGRPADDVAIGPAMIDAPDRRLVLPREIEILFGRALHGETEKNPCLALLPGPGRVVTSSGCGIGVRRPPHSTAPGEG